MRLQKRVFLMVMGIQILFIILMSITTSYRTVRAFSTIERRFFAQQMVRVQEAIDTEAKSMQSLISDWGAWDRMYSFMGARDVSHFDELLNGSILRSLGVDLLVVADEEMTPVVAYRVDELGNELPIGEDVTRPLMELARGIEALDPDVVQAEFLKLDDGAYMFRSAQILTTDWTGPSRGTILIGARTDRMLEAVSTRLELPCQFFPEGQDAEEGTPTPMGGDEGEGGRGEMFIHVQADNIACVEQGRGKVLGSDVPWRLSFRAPREIYSEGQMAMYNSYVWFFYNGVSLAILMIYFLSRAILRRIEALRALADRIIRDFDLSARPKAVRDDELGELAISFSALLDTLEHVIMEIPDALILSDSLGRVVLMNQEARRLMERQDFSRDEGEIFIYEIIRKAEGKLGLPRGVRQRVYEGDLCRPDGSTVPVELHENVLSLGGHEIDIYLARDLTERKALAARIDWNDHHDAYTGLPNRKSFVDILARSIQAASSGHAPVTLVLINMDHFKSVNAEVTNTGGDIILTVIAERIKNVLDGRGKLFRTSGDEFAVLFMEDEDGGVPTREELDDLLARIRDDIALPCQLGDHTVYPSACMGVLFDALRWDDPSLIIEKATTALKAAKKAGLGLIAVHKEEVSNVDTSFVANILRMRYELQEAVEQEQFVPYFQPIYTIEGRYLSGFEALVRWQHPTRGFLTPIHFVPYAERIGAIGQIDRLMMKRAIQAICDSPAPYYFSANGSADIMQRPDAADIIGRSMEKLHADPSRFAVEVTESVLIDDLEGVHRVLDELEDNGVRIFLDDFGTGYSSLQYLQMLPFDCIKLDQSFVRQVFTSERAMKMLRTIINMANMLGMETIAEGVETEDQLAWLGEAGCKKAQGYLFAKPLPWKDAAELIQKDHDRLVDEGLAG